MNLTDKLSVTTNTVHFSNDCFTKMRSMMRVKRVPKNNLIFFEGDLLDKLYFVLEGSVKLTKLNDAGKSLVFHYFFPDDLFGEFNPKQNQRSNFTARVSEDAVIGVIHQSDFEILLVENRELALEFLQWQNQIQRYTQMKLRDLLFHGKNGALAATLLRSINTYGSREGNHLTITKRFTDSDFAEMIGASRETINRLLTSFKKKGMIANNDGQMEILDIPGLKEMCHCEECPVTICRL